jgi:Gas vesicle protein G
MFIIDTLLFGGLRFVLDNIVAAAEAETHEDEALREQLLEAQMRLELGEIDEPEFGAIERDVLARMRELKAKQPSVLTMSEDNRITGIEIETYDTNR